ncbi:MAG: chlorophyll synthesis pathway protein BchC [Lautropia sp.]
MKTHAVVLEQPGRIVMRDLDLNPAHAHDLVVDVDWSGISTGTERLLWTGTMPAFPGMGYPLVPGYEATGHVSAAPPGCPLEIGSRVFVPGAQAFTSVRSLFGASAARLVVPVERVVPVDDALGDRSVLLALAATAYHALAAPGALPPELIVGHGVLARIMARIALVRGAGRVEPPLVWEIDYARGAGARGYRVIHPDADSRRDYRSIYDVSGDADILDRLISTMAPGGELTLAGFYSQRPAFDFAPAFIRETRIRVAAQWTPPDLQAVTAMVADGSLSLDGLITHHACASDASRAYEQAFDDVDCLKMVLDWRQQR